MDTPAFTTSFSGASLSVSRSNALNTPRCTMGDSIAPIIIINDTKTETTANVSVAMRPIAPSDAASVIATETALKIMLKGGNMPATLPPPTPAVCPPGTAPADFYFPKATRNTAPVITLGADESLSVSYDTIEATTNGVSSNSGESIAFWKAKTYKWAPNPDGPATPPPLTVTTAPEVDDSALYEKYFPSRIRNFAPEITLKAPAGDWDTTGYLTLSSEFVSLDTEAARVLDVKVPTGTANPAASGIISQNYGGSRSNMAPLIAITGTTEVRFEMEEVTSPMTMAREILMANGVTSE